MNKVNWFTNKPERFLKSQVWELLQSTARWAKIHTENHTMALSALHW